MKIFLILLGLSGGPVEVAVFEAPSMSACLSTLEKAPEGVVGACIEYQIPLESTI